MAHCAGHSAWAWRISTLGADTRRRGMAVPTWPDHRMRGGCFNLRRLRNACLQSSASGLALQNSTPLHWQRTWQSPRNSFKLTPFQGGADSGVGEEGAPTRLRRGERDRYGCPSAFLPRRGSIFKPKAASALVDTEREAIQCGATSPLLTRRMLSLAGGVQRRRAFLIPIFESHR